jgi:choline dehydrogenase-like flavoprotein
MSSYDYVVVGAGSAGCVLANRLSAGGARVLLLEAGGSDRKLAVRAPAAFPNQFQTAIDWNYLSEPEPGLYGRRLSLPRGKMLGGSSSMNAMIYIRGNRADYDAWASEHGATGWAYDDVLPLFKRSEHNAEIHDEYHGVGGEMHITRRRWVSALWEKFVAAAEALGAERNEDFNGARQDGAGLFQTTTKRGRRWSAADAFLRPALKRENLELITHALVRRIVVSGGRAVAVEYDRRGEAHIARADGEVVISAGGYGSPQLLMLSGIGPADHLREVGIEPLVDAPNVGAHLQEHPLAYLNWRSRDPDTLDDAAHPRHLLRWLAGHRGKLSSNVGEAGWHWRSDSTLPAPDFQMIFAPAYFYEHGFRKTGAPGLTVGLSYVGPVSRGSVRLRSADPVDHPRICNNMLREQAEVDAFMRAIETARELAATQPLASVAGEELNPSSSLRTSEELTSWLRATAEHTYHPACTCRIGSPEDGVVDAELRVHGVEGLRVADTSVMPHITSGNTHAPAVMIGEKCADLVLGAGRGWAAAPAEALASA